MSFAKCLHYTEHL